MQRLVGTLAGQDGNTANGPIDWTGYSVRLYYRAAVFGESRLVEKGASLYESGRYEFVVNGNEQDDADARIAAFAPSGEMIGAEKLSALLSDGGLLTPLSVRRRDPEFDLTPVEEDAARAVRVSGRLFAAQGGSAAIALKTVRLFGRAPGAESFRPLFSGATDRSGYFAGTTTRVPLAAALALVGGQGGDESHEIVLDGDWLPTPIFLFSGGTAGATGGAAADASHDCACDAPPPTTPDAAELAVHGDSYSADLGAACQTFTIPNRTLEEFDFYRIARTTDPEIQGITLPDTNPRPVRGVRELAGIVLDHGTLAQVTQISTIAAQDTAVATARAEVSTLRSENPAALRAFSEHSGAVRSFRETAAEGSAGPARATSLADYVNVAPLAATGTRTAATWRLATDDEAAVAALSGAAAKIPAAALQAALEDPDGFTPEKVMTLERRASAEALAKYLDWRLKVAPGRAPLTEDNAIDWDQTPHFYQATTIAHGHLLHFKQDWKADGYSLGELLKSVPLAPGQKKQIAVLDWDRSDAASRTEETVFSEALAADLSRDRDINEIANANFSESLRGGSSANVSAVGGGIGFAIGPLVIGGGGGSSWASSNAWSDNSRAFSAQTLNDLRDRTSQSAAAVRNQRATVVETVYQRERVGATTEVIANHNRCHALTIQYFEVLRHFAVQERLAGVQECLFVPLQMTSFDDAKVLRWHEILRSSCLSRDVLPGFESIRRLNTPGQIPPNRRFADDPIEELSGRLRVRVSIARPKDPEDATRAVEDSEWSILAILLRVSPETIYERYRRNSAERDRIFRTEIAPEVAQSFLESLQVSLVDREGHEHDSGFDITVASRYTENGIMEVELGDSGGSPRLTRADVAGVVIRSAYTLPRFSKVIVEGARLEYRTERMDARLFDHDRVLDDLQDGDPAFLSTTALTWQEERNQLTEDRSRRRRLLRHLNDHIEYYHRAIWLGMDPNRRYMLLDGFQAPRSGGRSVASVVDNRLLGIVGNCLVLPVAPGFQLDPLLAEAIAAEQADDDGDDVGDGDDVDDDVEGEERPVDPMAVLERLYRVAPSPPRRCSVPTRGVFAEAMTGTCKSCELIEEDRFWRWKDFPLPDAPPAIAPLSTDSRAAALGSLSPTAFPEPLVKFQALPDLPNPTGMAAALELLGKDVFKDLTGLTQNQRNAMAAFTTAMASSEAFAGEAFKLGIAQDAARNLDRTLGQIQSAKAAGYLDPKQASAAARDALTRAIGAEGSPAGEDLTTLPEMETALKKAAESPNGAATVTRGDGENKETVSFATEESALTIGAAPKGHTREYPIDIWLDLPLIKDQITAANDYEDSARSDNVELARFMGLIFRDGGGSPFFIDIIESALDAGFLRRNSADTTRFQIKVPATVGYPADPKDLNKVAPPKKGKYPFVALVHGNSSAWTTRPPASATGRTSAGLQHVKVGLDDRKDYEGYVYLQKALAELPQPIVSISFSHAFCNMVDSMIELRSEVLLEALRQVIAEAGKASALLADVDFQASGLMGHSRGGEAVVRAYVAQKAKAVPGLRCRAVCSVAPTDFRGSTNAHKMNMPAEPDANYLVVYGTLDGDVSGLRATGLIDRGGTGFRLYDRSPASKAMVTISGATHNRFNTKWPDGAEWPAMPAGVISRPDQETLAVQFIAGFFDLILNSNAARQPLFRNEVIAAPARPVAFQWQFGASQTVIDAFDAAAAQTGTRTIVAGGDRPKFASLTPPAAAADKSLEMRVPHDDTAYRITKASVGAATHTLAYDFGSLDVSTFDALTFRLGQLHPVADQPSINGAAPPVFKLVLEDGAGTVGTVLSTVAYANMKNGYVKPTKKEVSGLESTLMFLQTLQVKRKQLEDSAKPKSLDLKTLKSLKFEFDTGASAQDEIWLDSVLFVRN